MMRLMKDRPQTCPRCIRLFWTRRAETKFCSSCRMVLAWAKRKEETQKTLAKFREAAPDCDFEVGRGKIIGKPKAWQRHHERHSP